MARIIELNETHIRRLYGIAKALCTVRGLSISQIAKRFRVSRRTAFREMNVLRDLGLRLESDEGTYRLFATVSTVRRVMHDNYLGEVDALLRRALR